MDIYYIANIISGIGTCFGLFSRVPQVYKIYKSKSANDLSDKTLLINITANSCFLFNTIVHENYTIAINCITVVTLESTILYLKNKYKNIKKSSSQTNLVDMNNSDEL